MKPLLMVLCLAIVCLTACVTEPGNSNSGQLSSAPTPAAATENAGSANSQAVTLPVLDAFFTNDDSFASDLAKRVNLSDDEVKRIRAAAREETSKLRETNREEDAGSAQAARELSEKRLAEIIGADKTKRLYAFVRERWAEKPESAVTKSGDSHAEGSEQPNAVPKDTRVVVNSPAYRMDVFEDGHLIKSYKVGIGYPEFPLPTGLREAKAIIFNPTWTPPDEPWVESPSSSIKVGEKVEAGSKLNPLGLLKIPIGSPSLIHGGKSPAKLGTFASHGCVGLTDSLVQDFAKVLARVSGKNLTDAEIASFKKNRSETKQIPLPKPIPVELRYETIVVEEGKLHIFRDVYDRNTNTEENLRAVLESYGVKMDDLTLEEQAAVKEALVEMSRDARGKANEPESRSAKATQSSPAKPTSGKVTRTVTGKKEITIEIAALKGKGYPAMKEREANAAKTRS